MAGAFDKAAFRAKAKALAELRLLAVHLPGIGECWVRPLSAGDWVDSSVAQARLKEANVEVTARVRMAIGLAQNLCDDQGKPIFSIADLDDLNTLAALPMDVVNEALSKAQSLAPGALPDPKARAATPPNT